jgi:hypothetical protein
VNPDREAALNRRETEEEKQKKRNRRRETENRLVELRLTFESS